MKSIATLIILLVTYSFVNAQTVRTTPAISGNDSLDLPRILSQVISSYPSVVKAMEGINASDVTIALARSGYYPYISGEAGYTRLGPVSQLSFPNLGTFEIYPENNYNVQVDVRQPVYDFEHTSRKILEEQSGRKISEKNVDLVKQRLTLITAVSYYTLVYLQEAIIIKEAQMKNLNDHLEFVTKKKETGSATEYEILSTEVRISGVGNQLSDIKASVKTQQGLLNSLMGISTNTQLKVKKTLDQGTPGLNPDSLVQFAFQHRYEMIVAGLREEHAALHLRAVKVENNPSLDAFLSGGIKNGFIPDLNKMTPNFVAGLGLHVPIFSATVHKNMVKLAGIEINALKQETEQAKREIATEVTQNEAVLESSFQKISQFNLQVQQADAALALARISFSSGVITNLDLLDSETSDAESKLNLLKARSDYAVSLARLNISVGRPVY